MGPRLVIVAVLVTVLWAAPAAAGSSPEARIAKAGKHGKKCRKGQAKVRSGKRVLCVRLPNGAMQPRDEDPRLAAIKAGLTPSLVETPDPKGKLPPPMENVYRSFGPGALKDMEKAVAGSLVRLDGAAARPHLFGGPMAISPFGFNGSGYTESFGNLTIDIRLNIAKVASVEFALSSKRDDGRVLRVTYEIPLLEAQYQGFKGDTCPGADGKLKAKDGIGITVRSELLSNGGKTIDEYLVYKVIDKTDLRAEVGDDAKLNRLEINNIQEVWETSYDSSLYSGFEVKGLIVREGTVDMRSGDLNTTINNVEVGVVISGLLRLFSGTAQAGIAQRLRAAADEGWQATVKAETDNFRELEKGWNEPNRCAKLVFDKARESQTLRRGQSGDESVKVEAVREGLPPKADWTVGVQENGEFSLADHSSNPTKFHYKVTKASQGGKVKATFKAVTRAGVAEDSWIQKTDVSAVREITGTFGGEVSEETALEEPIVQSWNGSATFDRVGGASGDGAGGFYALASGDVTLHASGIDGTGITGCHQKGSLHGFLTSSTGGVAEVTGTGPEGGPPYTYTLEAEMPFAALEVELFACPKQAQEEGYENKIVEVTPLYKFNTGEQESADGLTYLGSTHEGFGNITIEQTWGLHGEP